jgi:hypothetical protein
MLPEDEEEVRIAVENNEYVAISYVKELLEEIDRLRSENKVDGPVYNSGRSEGRADVKAQFTKIVDPEDEQHFSIDGVLKEVEQLVIFKNKMKELITFIYESNALKEFAYSNDDGPSIAEMVRETYYELKNYKKNMYGSAPQSLTSDKKSASFCPPPPPSSVEVHLEPEEHTNDDRMLKSSDLIRIAKLK